MPSPRDIALQKNDRSKFKEPSGYDPKAGCPTKCVPEGQYSEWGKHPFREGGGSSDKAPKKGEGG